jgi:uncharacterized protein (TIGR01777 family)
MKKLVLLSGASGLIGTALRAELTSEGWECRQLVRRPAREAGEVEWHPGRGAGPDVAALGEPEVAVHLSGAGIADQRWTAARKKLIVDSRIDSTRALVEALSGLKKKPRLLICASAIGIYGDRGDEVLDEGSAHGEGFLPETCERWEAAAAEAAKAGIRVISARFGIVLAREGGAMARMLPLFRLGLGGPLGSGRQWMSWVSARDTARALAFLTGTTEGPAVEAVNVVAPNPVTNAEFTRELGRALHRPAFLPAPAFALRLAFGEMADAALLASTRVLPKRLEEKGFRFVDGTLGEAFHSATAIPGKL